MNGGRNSQDPISGPGTGMARDGTVAGGARTGGIAVEGRAAGRRVLWHRLVLRGFGPYRGEVRVDFPDGLVTLVAPNESGKSTLVAGLAAVIYGLPGSSDPGRFGQARFRHWLGAARFEGELEFTAADGHVYHLYRNFEDHRVRLTRRTGEGPVVEIEGVHNPGASRRNIRYEERIRELVRIGSRELLMQTFCVEQPLLPAAGNGQGRDTDRPALAAEVQHLLAGSGGGSHAGALEQLVERLKELTRATGDLGVTPRNQRAERELERLEQRMHSLEEAIARDREAADGLEQVRRRRAELAEERLRVERALESRERLARAWQDWRRLAERYREQVGRRVQMEQALDRARQLEREIEQGRRRLAAEWPELAAAGEGTGDDLDRLASLESLLAQGEGQREILARERREAAARAALAAWHRYRLLAGRLRELEERRAGYGLFESANDSLRERVRNIELEEERLRHEVEVAAREVESREAAWRALEEEERALAAAFPDVSELPPAVLEAIERKPELLERWGQVEEAARRAEEEHRRRQAAARRGAIAVAALGALAGAGGGLGLGLQGAIVAAVALVAALLAGLVTWRLLMPPETGDPALAREREQVEGELRRLDGLLGELAAEPPERLRALRERRREWEVRRQALEERRRQLPAPAEIATWRERYEAALRRQEEFAAHIGPFRRRYPDPAAALREWEELCRQHRRLTAALEALCREEWGAAPGAVPSRPAAAVGGHWAELAGLLAGDSGSLQGGRPGNEVTVAGVAARLEGFDPLFWERPEAEAAAWRSRLEGSAGHADELDEELQRLIIDQRGRAAATAERLRRLAEELEGHRREAGELRRRLGPVLEAAGGDAGRARARWAECQRHHQRLRELERELAGLLTVWQAGDVNALAAKVEQVRDGALVARQDLQRLAEAHEGLPSPEAVDDPAAIEERMGLVAQELEELRRRLGDLNDMDRQLTEQEAVYARSSPINIAAAEVELEALRRQREELREEIEALALAHHELQAAVEEYHATYRQRLEQAASRHFARITGREGRRVRLDEQFRVSVVEPDGTRVLPGQLSQGAQDQLYLALRVAIADLMAEDVRLPFVFDDPFVHCDEERLQRIRATLGELAGERQVLLLSHRQDLADWGIPAAVERRE